MRQVPQGDKRCKATRRPLSDGSLAQCMNARKAGSVFCAKHEAEANARVEAFQKLNTWHPGSSR